jgi:prepilin-type N-terminal cleavage/methylation domain-containing protein
VLRNDSRQHHSQQFAFTLVELLVVIAIIGILVALLLPAVQSARESARRAQCQSQLKNVALAVLNYESARKEFPTGMTYAPNVTGSVGNVADFTSTWLIDVLPYLEQQPLYDSFDLTLPVRHQNNSLARGTEIDVLLCPSDSFNNVKFRGASGGSGLGDNWARGNYAANAGGHSTSNIRQGPSLSGTPQPGANSGAAPAWRGTLVSQFWPASTRGVIGPLANSRIAQITDGTSNTMMLAEIRAGIVDIDPRGVWALGHAGASMVAGHGSGGDDNGPNACFARADDIPSSGLIEMSCNSPEVTNQLTAECMACNSDTFGFAQATARSLHVGGVFVAMADGSVDFVNEDIETSGAWGACCKAWDYLIMAADGGFRPAGGVRP